MVWLPGETYRFIDQPAGWLGEKTKPDVPYLTNLRLDPFERTGWPDSGTKYGAQQYFDWFKYEFWRFVFVQQQVEKLAMTAIVSKSLSSPGTNFLQARHAARGFGRFRFPQRFVCHGCHRRILFVP
jgi:hypothetical protein